MGLASFWGRLFTFTYDPQEFREPEIGFGIPGMYRDIGRLLEKHRPDLVEEHRDCADRSPREFGAFLDRNFPLGGARWGHVGVGDIVPHLRSILEPA